ncbi:MAG: hypothetical protein M3Q97_07050 [Bacteroidota bacterium]|nr:hypothetical protein [Bacteroidota bacterium]
MEKQVMESYYDRGGNHEATIKALAKIIEHFKAKRVHLRDQCSSHGQKPG